MVKKASFSQRMIDPSLPYGANEKVPTAVNEIYKIWNESKTFTDVNGNTQENGVQLVFCDYGVPKTESKSKTTSSVETEAENGRVLQSERRIFRFTGQCLSGT